MKYDYALAKYFNHESFLFEALDKPGRQILFKISLSYPELFAQIRNSENFASFFKGDSMMYYPHYFLLDKGNAQWFSENISTSNPELYRSMFEYSDWFSASEENLEIMTEAMLPTEADNYYDLLKTEGDIEYPAGDLEAIIQNVLEFCEHIDDAEGILEVIGCNETQFANVNMVYDRIEQLTQYP